MTSPPSAAFLSETLCPGLSCEVSQGVMNIVMEHGPTRNAFDETRSRALEELLGALQMSSSNNAPLSRQGHPIYVLALHSHCPGVWASGGDLTEISMRPQVAIGTMRRMKRVARAMKTIPALSVALLGGGAIGGGAELALCCDERWVISDAAFIELRQREWGLPAGWDGLPSLVHAGQGAFSWRSAALAFVTGQRWDTARLLGSGLATRDFRGSTCSVRNALVELAAAFSRCPPRLAHAYLTAGEQAPPDFEDFWMRDEHTTALANYEATKAIDLGQKTPQTGSSK